MVQRNGRDACIRLTTEALEAEEARQTIAWLHLPFVVLILDHGTRHSLVRGEDGEPVLVSESSRTSYLPVDFRIIAPSNRPA